MDYLKKADVRTVILAGLTVLVVIMFIIQIITLSALVQAQEKVQSMAARTDRMLGMVIDAEFPLEVKSEGDVLFTSNVSLPESIEAYVSVDIPIGEVLSINKDISVPIHLPGPLADLIGQDTLDLNIPVRLDLPLSTVVHIDQSVPVRIGQDIPFSTSVPIQTRAPISINLDETPLQSELQAFRIELREFAGQ